MAGTAGLPKGWGYLSPPVSVLGRTMELAAENVNLDLGRELFD